MGASMTTRRPERTRDHGDDRLLALADEIAELAAFVRKEGPAMWNRARQSTETVLAEDAIAALLKPTWLREHTSDYPWDEDDDDACGWPCGCEDTGWMCPDGDGPLIPFLKGEREAIELAAQTALLHDEEA